MCGVRRNSDHADRVVIGSAHSFGRSASTSRMAIVVELLAQNLAPQADAADEIKSVTASL
jgi:hypothetical protein